LLSPPSLLPTYHELYMGEPNTNADKNDWDRGARYNSRKLDLNPTKPILFDKRLIPEETRLIQGKME